MPFELDSFGKTETQKSSQVWLHAVGIFLLCMLFSFLINPEDPFFRGAGAFSWIVMAPILVALRYGFREGFIVGLAVIGASFACAVLMERPDWQLSTSEGLGMLIVVMLVGEFRDIWERRLRKLERSNEYRQARLQEFTRAHHILKISHDRLEHASAGKADSLRTALLDLQQQCAATTMSGACVENQASLLCSILRTYGTIQKASLHSVDGTRPSQQAIGQIGEASELVADDPLLLEALASRNLCSVRADLVQAGEQRSSVYLACLPLVDTFGKIHAVMAIETLPFFALSDSNLKMLAILAGRLADMFSSFEDFPALPDEHSHQFFREVRRCARDVAEFDLQSSVLAIRSLNAATGSAYFDTVLSNTRGLDLGHVLFENGGKDHVLLLLMPLTDSAGVQSYLVRLEEFMREHHEIDLVNAGLTIHQHTISAQHSERALWNFLNSELGLRTAGLSILEAA